MNYTAHHPPPTPAETWSRRAKVRRARKSNIPAGADEKSTGGQPPQLTDPLTRGGSSDLLELCRILQPNANGLTPTPVAKNQPPPQPTAPLTNDGLAHAQTTVDRLAESALRWPAGGKSAESAHHMHVAAMVNSAAQVAADKPAESVHLHTAAGKPAESTHLQSSTVDSSKAKLHLLSASVRGHAKSATTGHRNEPTSSGHISPSQADHPSSPVATTAHSSVTQAIMNDHNYSTPNSGSVSTLLEANVTPNSPSSQTAHNSRGSNGPLPADPGLPTSQSNRLTGQSSEMEVGASESNSYLSKVATAGDAVSATLLFANADSSLFNSNPYEVDIVKIHNNQLPVAKKPGTVTKETDATAMETGVTTMETSVTAMETDVTVVETGALKEGAGGDGQNSTESETRKCSADDAASKEAIEEREKESSFRREEEGVKCELEKEASTGKESKSRDNEEIKEVEVKEEGENLSGHTAQEEGTAGSCDTKEEGTKPSVGEVAGNSEVIGSSSETVQIKESQHLATPSPTTPGDVTTSPLPTTPISTMNIVNSAFTQSLPAIAQSPPILVSPPTGAHSPPTSPLITVFQNMTYVPYISNNHLYLYPVATDSLPDHTHSHTHQSHSHLPVVAMPINTPTSQHRSPWQQNEFPNSKIINRCKVPKRRRRKPKSPSGPASQQNKSRPLVTSPPSKASRVSWDPSSEDAMEQSLCLRRKEAGLPTNPFSLTYTVTSTSGRSWTTNSLEGEELLKCNLICTYPLSLESCNLIGQ